MNKYEIIIGSSASFLTTSSLLPQAIKVFRTKETRGISISTYFMLLLGFTLWVAYGFLRTDLPLILTNIISFLLVLPILGITLKNHRNKIKDLKGELPSKKQNNNNLSGGKMNR